MGDLNGTQNLGLFAGFPKELGAADRLIVNFLVYQILVGYSHQHMKKSKN